MPRLVPTFRPPASRRRVIACLACLAVQRPELGLRDVPGPNAAFRVERYQIRPEDEQRRDGGVVVVIQSRRSERAQPVRAPADDDRRADPDEREVVAARQRGDVRAALAAKLRPHQFQSHLLAVVNLERPPRGDGHERLRAPAVHRERRALGDVPERAERVEKRVSLRARSVSRSRLGPRRSRRGRLLGRARLRIRLVPTTTASSRGTRGGLARRGSLLRGRHRVLRRPRSARWDPTRSAACLASSRGGE